MRGAFITVIEPVVDVYGDINWPGEDAVASCCGENLLADAVALLVDRVRVQSAEVRE